MTQEFKVISLEIDNIKRISAARIEPDGSPVVVIGGNNGQGKSSILDAIWMALGGRAATCDKPITDGAAQGTIKVDLGDYVVTRKFFEGGRTTLEVRNAVGAKYSSPQALLDALVGDLSFDPMVFARQSNKAQVDTLRKFSGLDFDSLDKQRAAAFEKRTDVNRDGKRLAAQLEGMPLHDDAPGEKVSVVELMAELEEAAKLAADRDARVKAVAVVQDARDCIDTANTALTAQLDELNRQRDKLTTDIEEKCAEFGTATAALMAASSDHVAWCAENPPHDTDAIKAKVAGADELNAKLAQNEARAKLEDELGVMRSRSANLGEEIEGVDAKKRGMLEAANLPVDGMAFGVNGVAIKGIPFAQCSSAEQICASFALGAAMSPQLRVMFIRDGSLLDGDSKALVTKLAEEHGLQAWMEVVGNSDDVTVLIEDGAVVEAPGTATESAA